MYPRLFLRLGGTVLVITGFLGIVGILGAISAASFFHPPSWINWFHLFFGSFVFTASIVKNGKLQTVLTKMAAVVAITIGVGGLVFGSYFATKYNIPELSDPSDHLAHLVVGLCAIWALWKKKSK